MASSELPNEQWRKLSEVAVLGAVYDSPEREPHPECLKGTRVDLLKYIYGILDNPGKSQLIWLHGTAGVGKSAVAFTVAERMRGLKASEVTNVEKRLAGTFFFSRTTTNRCTTGYVFATLAYQLARNFSIVRSDVSKAIAENPAVLDPNSSLRDQMEALFLRPLRKLRERQLDCPPLSFVIDALDECTSETQLAKLISLLGQALHDPDLPKFHILLTSRSEAHVREAMEEEGVHPLVCEIPVKNSGDGVPDIISLDGADVDNDICIFLDHSFTKLRRRYPNFPQLVGGQLNQLANRAGRRFIVASTMIKFINDGYNDPRARLQIMLDLTSQLLPGTEVYKLYDSIISTCAEPDRAYMHLSVIATLADPLPVSQIVKLLGPGEGKDVEATLLQLRSVVDIPTDSNLPVNISHSSVRDYVSNPSNCSLPLLYISPHSLLAYSSLCLMIHDIPISTALLDGLVELTRYSEAVPSEDPQKLRKSLAFVVQPPDPLQVLSGLLWIRTDDISLLHRWLETPDGRAWLETQLDHEYSTENNWLRTKGGHDWLETEHGKCWLQENAVIWLRTDGGENWLQTQAGQNWLQTTHAEHWLPRGGWLSTQAGRDWLQTQPGKSWLQTVNAKHEWLLTTREGGDWLQTRSGGDWLQTQSAGDWMLIESSEGKWRPIVDKGEDGNWPLTPSGRVWLQTQSIQNWLQTSRGRCWLLPEGRKDRLEIEGGSEFVENWVGQGRLEIEGGQDWLKTEGGQDWLWTEGGKDWLQSGGGKAWVQTESGQDWVRTPRWLKGQAWIDQWLQTQAGRDCLQTQAGQDWLKTQDGRDWLQVQAGQDWLKIRAGEAWLLTQAGRDWLQTRVGQDRLRSSNDWLETQDGQDWLQTQAGQDWLQWKHAGGVWLQTQAGQDWLQTQAGQDWLKSQASHHWPDTQNGQDWLQTQAGQDWLKSQAAHHWLNIRDGRGWLRTQAGKDWLQTHAVEDWLNSQAARHWLQTQAGQDWLKSRAAHHWLNTQDGQGWLRSHWDDDDAWLQTENGRDWLRNHGGEDWLQTKNGRDWLRTQGGDEWLQTDNGKDWLKTPFGKAWPFMAVKVTIDEFWSALEAVRHHLIDPELPYLPAYQVIRHLKSLPDFLMFPVFLALRHHNDSTSASPQDHFPDVAIIRAMKAFVHVADKGRERSRSASDALKYACHNWAMHLARAPRPWDTPLGHIFCSFWNDNLLYWLEMQWCSKGLRACLTVLREGERLAGEYQTQIWLECQTRSNA